MSTKELEKARVGLGSHNHQAKQLKSVIQERDSLKQERLLMQQHIEVLESKLIQANDSVAERFRELALLTELLEHRKAEIEALHADHGRGFKSVKKPFAINGLVSSITLGKRARELRRLRREEVLIKKCGLFDGDWYLRAYPDVAGDEVAARNPLLHYLKFGGFEGRNPGPGFDSQWYLDVNPDVKDSGINPLVHYVSQGRDEGRLPRPHF